MSQSPSDDAEEFTQISSSDDDAMDFELGSLPQMEDDASSVIEERR